MQKSDAEVALRSFGRRYSEVLNGPAGDPAWDRLVRQPDTSGMSAMGYALLAVESLTALGALLTKLPSEAQPVLSLTDHREAPFDTTVADTITSIKNTSAATASALDARTNDDLDRTVQLDGHPVTVSAAVQEVVDRCARGVRAAQSALDATT